MDKIGETTVAKNMRDGWAAKTKFALGIESKEGPRVLIVETSKNYNRLLATRASVHTQKGNSMAHAFSLANDGSGDFSKTIIKSPTKCTERAVRDQHAEALKQLDAIEADARAHYQRQDDARALNERRERELAAQDAAA